MTTAPEIAENSVTGSPIPHSQLLPPQDSPPVSPSVSPLAFSASPARYSQPLPSPFSPPVLTQNPRPHLQTQHDGLPGSIKSTKPAYWPKDIEALEGHVAHWIIPTKEIMENLKVKIQACEKREEEIAQKESLLQKESTVLSEDKKLIASEKRVFIEEYGLWEGDLYCQKRKAKKLKTEVEDRLHHEALFLQAIEDQISEDCARDGLEVLGVLRF